uniref:Uncharacterized protein n=1 Tax=Arundo donax TaxID=35708 RepID=A0A0A8ZGI4_ARUDO
MSKPNRHASVVVSCWIESPPSLSWSHSSTWGGDGGAHEWVRDDGAVLTSELEMTGDGSAWCWRRRRSSVGWRRRRQGEGTGHRRSAGRVRA